MYHNKIYEFQIIRAYIKKHLQSLHFQQSKEIESHKATEYILRNKTKFCTKLKHNCVNKMTITNKQWYK